MSLCSFFFTHLNAFTYFYLIWINLFTLIICLYTVQCFQVLQYNNNIIIIMSRQQHVYPWPSLTTLSNRPLLLVGLQGYIPYRHWAVVCRFYLVVLPLLSHVKRSASLMSSSLLLQQCPACLVRLILIVFEMDGRWPYSCCFVGCCIQDLFNIARSTPV